MTWIRSYPGLWLILVAIAAVYCPVIAADYAYSDDY
jgi:hypothetical protein